MAGPLDEYRRKRDFARTPEPAPGPLRTAAEAPVFVVHRHEARNLHYDLRLEADGVLRSWAVPRGFSYQPGDKRLAVRTEDHPLEYEHFHGRIPKGEYGAGTMRIWDRGRYQLVKITDWATALQQGEVKVRLFGRRLRGEWHLVKTNQGKNTWLLFKSRDRWSGTSRDSALGVDLDAAVEAPLPAAVAPMRCGGERAPFADPDWLFEMDLRGLRTFAGVAGGRGFLRGLERPPASLLQELSRLRADQALIDGVLVALDPNERPCPATLADRLARGDDDRLCYYAFDLLHWEDYDLRPLPLLDRKAALRALLPEPGRVLFVDHVVGSGPLLLDAIGRAGLPGAIAKRARSGYAAGPSADWLRVPASATATEAILPVRQALAGGAVAGGGPARVKLSNLDKVWFPQDGITKGDVLAWYGAVADLLLPHLRDRPVHLNRFPDGIDGKSFYQREAKAGTPAWIRTEPLQRDDGIVPHHVCNDRDTLLYLVNLGSIDLHPWLSRVGSPDSPDFAVLDLDAKESPFGDVVRIARAAGRLLRGIGLQPLLKTSGASGMHVYIPLRPGYSYDHSRMFTEAVARVLARELPDIATVERLPRSRAGKVYLDFLQNRRSQTVVPPYAVRPVPGAQVSMPLHWDELEGDLHPSHFTVRTALDRVLRLGDLFRPALEQGTDLLPAIDALQQVLREG